MGIQDLSEELAGYYGINEKEGALATRVFENDPADKAGIRKGDVIVDVDGNKVKTSRDLTSTIANLPVGKKAKVGLLRNGEKKAVTVTLAKRDDSQTEKGAKEEKQGESLGLKLTDVKPESARYFGYDPDVKGVLVAGVDPDGKAAKAGIRQGDLILEINRTPVDSMKAFEDQLARIDAGKDSQFLIRRARAGFFAVKLTR